MRDIAADAGVDVAYVHRSFGSKKKLFAEAMSATARLDRLLAGPAGDLPRSLARQVLARDPAPVDGEVQPLDILIRSLTSTEAMRIVHEFTLQNFVGPLAAKLEQPAQLRAALIAAFLAGIGIFRNVLRIEALLEAEGGEVEALVMSVIAGMMHTPTADAGQDGRPAERSQPWT